jgi:hypothetical protein
LSSDHIHRHYDRQIRNFIGANFLDQGIKFIKVDISFKRMEACRIVRFIDDNINKCPAGKFLM